MITHGQCIREDLSKKSLHVGLARSERESYFEHMEQERTLRADLVEFARSVEMLRATWAETTRLADEVLALTRIGMQAIELARIVGRAGRPRLKLMEGTPGPSAAQDRRLLAAED